MFYIITKTATKIHHMNRKTGVLLPNEIPLYSLFYCYLYCLSSALNSRKRKKSKQIVSLATKSEIIIEMIIRDDNISSDLVM